MKQKLIVRDVQKGSAAAGAGLRRWDRIVSVNGVTVESELDFVFNAATTEVLLTVVRRGKRRRIELMREGGETTGLSFVPVPVGRCCNRCLFCFIDQMPPGLRTSLYVKDEDYRHSFLYGNFVTLTGMRPADMERVVSMRLSPLYVSVHATEPQVRRQLLGNPRAPDIRVQLDELAESGIQFHTQIVVCPGYNDGAVLRRTLHDLLTFADALLSIGVVPVGLTRFRKKPLQPVERRQAEAIVAQVLEFSDQDLARTGTRRIFPADELLLKAGRRIPPASFYEQFPQCENGIGLVRLFKDDLRRALRAKPAAGRPPRGRIAVLTGVSAFPFLDAAVQRLRRFIPEGGDTVTVHAVSNRFFGEGVTVAGLLTARDVLRTLRELHLKAGDTAVVPAVMFNDRGFTLDSYSSERMAREAGCRLTKAGSGKELRDLCIDFSGAISRKRNS